MKACFLDIHETRVAKEGSFFILWENLAKTRENLFVLLCLFLLRVSTGEILLLTGSNLPLNCVESMLLEPESIAQDSSLNIT